MIRPFTLNINYCNFNKITLFVLLGLIIFATGTQASNRKIISIKADNNIHYMNRGDEVEILYHFKTSEYEPGEAPQEIELYKPKKLELFQLRELLIGRSTNGSFHINPSFSHYIKASSHERKMKVVISRMDHHKEGYYQLRISNNGTSFLDHTTSITKEGDACTAPLHGPLTSASVNQIPWPKKIKSLHLCPPDGVTYSKGTYCVKDNDTPTEFRFAFEYYDNSKPHPTTGFVLKEKIPNAWNYIMGVNMHGRAYHYGDKDKNGTYNVEAYFINNGIAFTLDFKNSSECVSTDLHLTMTMRNVGIEDVAKRFTVETDCLKNDCKPSATVFQYTEAPTTYDYTEAPATYDYADAHTAAASQATTDRAYYSQLAFRIFLCLLPLLVLPDLTP